MNIQIFGSSKSFDTKKAERWFKERRIKYQYIDVLSKGLSPANTNPSSRKLALRHWSTQNAGPTRNCTWPISPRMHREEKLLTYPELFNTPIVRNGKEATVGYCPEIWGKWE